MTIVKPLLTLAGLVLATVLAAVVVWRLATEKVALEAVPPERAWRPDLGVVQAVDLDAERPTFSYPDTLARPVFAPSRRPPPPKAEEPPPVEETEAPPEIPAEPQPPPITAEQFQLSGILVIEGERRAFLRSPSSPEGAWVGVGASVDGWVVDDVQPGSATLSAGGASHRLDLYGVAAAPH